MCSHHEYSNHLWNFQGELKRIAGHNDVAGPDNIKHKYALPLELQMAANLLLLLLCDNQNLPC